MKKILISFFIFSIIGFSALLFANTSLLDSSDYEIHTGDFDTDGDTDVLIRVKDKFSIIPISDFFVPIKKDSDLISFILEQTSPGQYVLIANPSSTELNSSNWIKSLNSDFSFFDGDFNGDGLIDVLITSSLLDVPSFILFAGNDLPSTILSQVIDSNEYSTPLGNAEILVADINNDSKDDLLLTIGTNVITLISAVDGTLIAQSDDPLPNTDFSQPSDNPHLLSSSVGAIPGDFSVSETGRANYRIPLRLPPSVQDILPDYTLTYTGENFNDVFGVGWYLEGLSEISRCATTLVDNNFIDGVNFNSKDRYCLNGQPLKLISTSGSQYEYRTQIESHAKIIGFNNPPTHFIVYRPTGIIEEYGTGTSLVNDALNRNVAWKISKLQDRQSNYVLYNYLNTVIGKHKLDSILYTGNTNASLSPPTEIKFNYENRSDVIKSHANSELQLIDERVNKIQISINSELVREYRLDYSNTLGTGMSLMTSIQDCPHDNAGYYCIQPTNIEWVTNSLLQNYDDTDTSTDSSQNPISNEDQSYHLGDVNGDGLDDLIWTYRNVNDLGRVLWLADQDGNGFTLESSSLDSGFNASFTDDENQEFLTGDFNGDGRTDLLYVAYYQDRVFRNLYISELTTNQGISSYEFVDKGYQVDTHNDPGKYSNLQYTEFLTGDVNGDGRTDIVFIYAKDKSLGRVVYLADTDSSDDIFIGKTSTDYQDNDYSVIAYDINNFILADVNGDGKDDLVYAFVTSGNLYRSVWLSKTNGARFYPSSVQKEDGVFASQLSLSQFAAGDVNGDGKADLVWAARDGSNISRRLYISDIKGNKHEFEWSKSNNLGNVIAHINNQIQLRDTNADGYADFIYSYITNNQYETQIHPTKVTTAEIFFDDSGVVPTASSSGSLSINQNHHYLMGDLNYDGRPDLVWAYNNSGTITQSIFKSPQVYPDHVDKITDGFGNTIDIIYEYLADQSKNIYTNNASATYPERKDFGLNFAVAEVNRSNGIGTQNKFNYSYAGAKTHLRGRGFLGFSRVTVSDQERDFKTDIFYNQTYPLIGRTTHSLTINLDTNNLVEATLNHWKSTNVPTSNTVYPYLKDSAFIQYELIGSGERSAKLTINTLDIERGIVTNTQEVLGYTNGALVSSFDPTGSFTESQISTRQLKVDTTYTHLAPDFTTNWRLGFLTSETKEYFDQDDTATASRTIQNTFTPYNNLADTYLVGTETRFVGSNVWVEMNYSQRDAYGNITKIITDAALISNGPYTEDVGPYLFGLYPDWRENRLQQRSLFTYDLRNGLVNKITDPNGLDSFQLYDDFGRLVVDQTVAGQLTKSSYSLCTSNCGNSKYTITTTTEHRDASEATYGSPTVTITYDMFDRELSRSTVGFDDTQSVLISKAYDSLGRLQSQSEPRYASDTEHINQYTYDATDRLTREAKADASEIIYAYETDNSQTNARSKQIQTHNIDTPNGIVSQVNEQWTNSLAQVIKVDDAENVLTDLKYDALGNLKESIVDNNQDTKVTIVSDVAGNRTQLIDPDIGEVNFIYDGLGNEREQYWGSTPTGDSISSNYDAIGRLITRTDAKSSGSDTYNWYYDNAPGNGIGQIERIEGPDFNESYEYDHYSRQVKTITTLATISPKIFNVRYDGYDRLISRKFPSGFAISNEYNDHGYIFKTSDKNTSEDYWVVNTKDARDNYTNVSYANNLSTSKVFNDRNGYLENISTGPSNDAGYIQSLAYQHDTAGNLYQRDSSRGITGETFTETFLYDKLNRLTSATSNPQSGSRTITIEYDALGNIKTKSDVSDTDSYEYSPSASGGGIHAVSRVEKSGVSTDYFYDSKGNMTLRGSTQIAYSVFNKPTLISDSGFTTTFKYSPQRKRFFQSHSSNGNVRNTYYYPSGNFELIQENGTTVLKSFIGDYLVHTRVGLNENFRYTHRDNLESTESITDENGNLISRLWYDTHGDRLDDNWEEPSPVYITQTNQNSLIDTSIGFASHEYLQDSGLIHMTGRIYDPVIGRFLTPDPVVQLPSLSQAYNRYSYVLNNPVSLRDPSGEIVPIVIAAVAVAYKAYNVYDTASSSVENFKTLTDNQASTGDKIFAVADTGLSLLGAPKPLRTIFSSATDTSKKVSKSTRNSNNSNIRKSNKSKGTDKNTDKNNSSSASNENNNGSSGNNGKPGDNGDGQNEPPFSKVKFEKPQTKRDGRPEILTDVSREDAVETLKDSGFSSKPFEAQNGGIGQVLTKDNKTITTFPKATSTGGPTGKVTVDGERKSTIRFNSTIND